ncbi:MAG: DUF1559 domain-containing protein, partial [Planctomycetaceae bacterium]|nr:DUF1559 domain-containing protein [Planctomycetaceae bacterium]
LGLALHNYEGTYKMFPPSPVGQPTEAVGGRYLQNWLAWSGVAMLLPYMEQDNVYKRANFNYRWDNNNGGTVNNSVVARQRIENLLCPSDPGGNARYTANMGPTSYNLSAGPCSNWSVGTRKPGLVTLHVGSRMGDITDGTSNSIAMSESKLGLNLGQWDPNKRPRVDWYRVVTGNRLQRSNNAAGRVWQGTQAHATLIKQWYESECLAKYDSGSGWNGASDEQGRFWAAGRVYWGPWFNTLMPPNAGPSCDVDSSVTDMDLKNASSYHTGGVTVLLCDGSVKFVTENIDHVLWIGAGSINGGETLGEW